MNDNFPDFNHRFNIVVDKKASKIVFEMAHMIGWPSIVKLINQIGGRIVERSFSILEPMTSSNTELLEAMNLISRLLSERFSSILNDSLILIKKYDAPHGVPTLDKVIQTASASIAKKIIKDLGMKIPVPNISFNRKTES